MSNVPANSAVSLMVGEAGVPPAEIQCNIFSFLLNKSYVAYDTNNKCILITNNYPSVESNPNLTHSLTADGKPHNYLITEIRIYGVSNKGSVSGQNALNNDGELIIECQEYSSNNVSYIVIPLSSNQWNGVRGDIDHILNYTIGGASTDETNSPYKSSTLPSRLNINDYLNTATNDTKQLTAFTYTKTAIITNKTLFGNGTSASSFNVIVLQTSLPIDTKWTDTSQSYSIAKNLTSIYGTLLNEGEFPDGSIKNNASVTLPNVGGTTDQLYIDCNPDNAFADSAYGAGGVAGAAGDGKNNMLRLDKKDVYHLATAVLVCLFWVVIWAMIDGVIGKRELSDSIRMRFCRLAGSLNTPVIYGYTFNQIFIFVLLFVATVLFLVAFVKKWKTCFLRSVYTFTALLGYLFFCNRKIMLYSDECKTKLNSYENSNTPGVPK